VFAGNLRVAKITDTTLEYFHKDHLGSTNAISREDGTIIDEGEYLPYGLDRSSNALLQTSSYKFTDQEQDVGTGLYNYDARMYDPVWGQFVMADTIVPDMFNPQSLNRYAYCLNNPVRYVDPTGHHTRGPESPGHSPGGGGDEAPGGFVDGKGNGGGDLGPGMKIEIEKIVNSSRNKITKTTISNTVQGWSATTYGSDACALANAFFGVAYGLHDAYNNSALRSGIKFGFSYALRISITAKLFVIVKGYAFTMAFSNLPFSGYLLGADFVTSAVPGTTPTPNSAGAAGIFANLAFESAIDIAHDLSNLE